ncbi:MAG TPA: GTPase, partial [Pseudomonadales bacterium]
MIPTFAVVGHPNKGKSSIVATLAEDERLAIGPSPGTTRRASAHTFSIDGEPQYVLVDTPGFQRVKGVYDWLQARSTSAHERPRLVEEFVRTHQGDERY